MLQADKEVHLGAHSSSLLSLHFLRQRDDELRVTFRESRHFHVDVGGDDGAEGVGLQLVIGGPQRSNGCGGLGKELGKVDHVGERLRWLDRDRMVVIAMSGINKSGARGHTLTGVLEAFVDGDAAAESDANGGTSCLC